MHELALAEAVLDIAQRHAAGRRVMKVHLHVGALRQVVPDALSFSFALLSAGTVADGAELAMTFIPARGVCRACQQESRLEALPLCCACCGGFDLRLTSGEELLVEALDLEDGHGRDDS